MLSNNSYKGYMQLERIYICENIAKGWVAFYIKLSVLKLLIENNEF